jgi:3-mercaptopyruvate sulfurtransferase SseA
MRSRALSVAVCVLLTSVCPARGAAQQEEEDTSSPALRIEWAAFKKLYDAKKIEVIDVRTEAVYETGHIPRSRSIPLDRIAGRVDELRKLNKPLVLYCS